MKALVVVDYQVDFVSGALGFEEAKLIEPVILKKIENTRKEGGKIIFTLDTHGENYLDTQEGRKLPIKHCVEGTKGHELYGKLSEALDNYEDAVIKKPAFGSMELADTLRKYFFDEVELCGLVTDICVISNAVIAKAALPEAKIVVDSRACGSGNIEMQRKALDIMKNLQIEVIE